MPSAVALGAMVSKTFVPWSPNAFGAISWWDASAPQSVYTDTGLTTPVVADTDLAAGVFDLANTGIVWSQSTLANRAAWRTNVLGGLPVLRFDGANDFLSGNSVALNLVAGKSAFTFVSLEQSATADIQRCSFFGSTSAAAGATRFAVNRSPAGNLTPSARRLDADASGAGPSCGRSDTWAVVHITVDHAADLLTVYRNGSQVGQTTGWQAAGSPQPWGSASLAVSIGANGAGSQNWLGDIAEQFCFSRVLSADEIAFTYTWLRTKWSLP